MFSITVTLSVQAVEFDKKTIEKLRKMEVYFGNPLENFIVGKGNMYVVIHNPTELALTVMTQEAREYCKQTLGNNYSSKFSKILGKYTAYYSCEMISKIDEFDISDEEKKCIEDRALKFNLFTCSELNKKNADIVNSIELKELNEAKFKKHDFIFSIRAKFFDQIETHEQNAEDKKINRVIQKNIKICKGYNFEVGSKNYNQCLISLISKNNKADK